jgi:hypothetical protein
MKVQSYHIVVIGGWPDRYLWSKVRASRLRERVNLHLALGGDFKGTGAPEK